MKRLLLPLLGGATLLAATAVNAQNLTAPTVNGTVNQQNLSYTITYTPGANSGGFDFVATYDSAEPASVTTTVGGAGANDVTETVANGSISCSTTATTISCIANANDTANDLGTGTITILFDVGATTGTAPITFTNFNFFDQDGNPEAAGTATDGAVNIAAAPVVQAPTLTFNPPAPGPIVLNATGGGSIAVTASTGTAGTSTTLACTSTNGTATANPASYGEAGGTGTVTVQCTPVVGAAGSPFTVSCDPTQSAGTDQPAQVFDATCPAITPQPEFSAALSASLVGAPGATLTGSIGISNTGNAPLTITCGAPTGGFTVTSAPASPVAAGGSTSIGISCVAPAAAGATTTGSLVCTTNDTDETTVTFALSCTSQVLSVPSLGNTAKGLMIALLAGLGLLGFAMRRRVV